MMPTLYQFLKTTYWVCGLLLCTSSLPAQTPLTLLSQEFKYNDGRKGEGRFQFYCGFAATGEVVSESIPSKTLNLNTKGAAGGTLTIRFRYEDLKLRANHRIILRNSCFTATPFLQPAPNSESEFTYERNAKFSGKFVFEVLKNGSGELKIGFDVVEDGTAEARCSRELTLPFTISGIPEEEKPDCEKALALFKTENIRAEQELYAFLQKFPEAPCKTEINERLIQIGLYKGAAEASISDCKNARVLCLSYLKKYNGANAFFATEMQDILKKCPEKKILSDTKPLAETKSRAQQDWESIKGSKNADDYKGYIERYGDDITARSYIPLAKQAYTRLSPMEIRENRISDFEREYEIVNAIRPMYKDMSPTHGLTVDAGMLESANKLKVTLDRAGDYLLRIVDVMGKDSTIRISNAFSGAMTPLAEGAGYFIKISGGRPPYSIVLEDLETNTTTTLRSAQKADTVMLQTAELNGLNLTKQYRVRLKSTGLTEAIDLGLIDNTAESSAPVYIIFALLGILLLAIAIYRLVVYLRTRNARPIMLAHQPSSQN